MNKKTKLNLGMAILYLVIFVVFGIIIVNEKLTILIMPKFEEYINNNYKEISHTIEYSSLQEENNKHYLIIENTSNKNLNFKITYSNNNFITTYQEDYIEGNSIITYLEEKHSTDDYKINIEKKLNEYTKEIQDKIIDDNFLDLSIYQINKDITLDNFTIEEITNILVNSQEENLNPSTHNFTITNNQNIVESIEINNLTTEVLNNPYFYLVITDILNNNKSDFITENNITFKHLN